MLSRAVRWVTPCATLPLLFGVIAFVGWITCYWTFAVSGELWFIMLGVGSVVVGTLAVLAGGTILIAHLSAARKLAAEGERRRVLMHAGFLGTLLVMNFPLAFFMGVVAVGAFPAAVLQLDNRSTTLTGITVVDAGRHEIGKAFGNELTRLRFRPTEAFEKIIATRDGDEIVLLKSDSVRADAWGPRVLLVIDADGTVHVHDTIRRTCDQ